MFSPKVSFSSRRIQICEESYRRSAFTANPERGRRMGLFPGQTVLVGTDFLRGYRAGRGTGGRPRLDVAQILAGSRRRLASLGRSAGTQLEHVALRAAGAIARRVRRTFSKRRGMAAFLRGE